jgi:glycosyltransferase involved in cell wall biosynthesis
LPALSSVAPSTPGLNIVGYVTADLGVGQSARGAAQAAEATGIEYSMVDFAMGTISPKTDRSYSSKISAVNEHTVNLVHVNADQFPSFRRAMGADFFAGKKTIAYWAWELMEFPEEWTTSFADLTEVWVPSRFVQSAISDKAPVPVVLMPHPIAVPKSTRSRARFGLPEARFLFLTMYDVLSYQERKNPAAAVAAFRKVAAAGTDAGLVIKVLNADQRPEEMEALRLSLEDVPGVILLSSTLSRQEAYDLEATCDAFVSLHRAEGFGFALAECMHLGKPVIGTNWSGNTDYMNSRNSCPVDYRLVELDRDHGPYKKGQKWADPDVDHAAWHMRSLAARPELAASIGAEARATMLSDYSPRAIGLRYRARLERIRQFSTGDDGVPPAWKSKI